MYTRSKRPRTGRRSGGVSEKFEDELIRELQGLRQKELENTLDPWASPLEPNADNNQRERPTLFEEFGPPTIICGNPQQVQQMPQRAARGSTQIENATREDRLEWYMDAALREIQVALRLAGEGRLRQADLWDLLTFGQHMYAGMKEKHGIDLNSALLDRERGNMGGEQQGATPAVGGGSGEFPCPLPPPRRCSACSRVVAADAEPGTTGHPSNRSSFTRLYPQEDRYESGGLFGLPPHLFGTAHDIWNPYSPMRPGAPYRGWNM